MNVENKVRLNDPKSFFDKLSPGEPFVMVNLLKFKENAKYEDGGSLSGAEAYQKYLDGVNDLVQKLELDIQILNDSEVFGLLIGEVEELWDRVVLVRYPSKEVFQQITQSAEFQEAQKHRIAGLAGQLNIGTKAS